jgi:F-type H+-transporting ATPase subunit delta
VVKEAIGLLKKELGLRDSIFAVMNLAADKKRLMFINKIVSEFEAIYDVAKNRMRVEMASAIPVPDEARESISRILSASLRKEILLSLSVKPELLGGLILKAGDMIVDGSVRTMLNKLGGKLTD